VFDTWTSAKNLEYDYSNWNDTAGTDVRAIPVKLRILALRITLRIWDVRTQTTRQITIVQDM
jgi:hypothetical protein